MGRQQTIPLVRPNALGKGYLYRNRTAYLGSQAPTAPTIAYSSEWNNTSQATRLDGAWDSPLKTPDVQYSIPANLVFPTDYGAAWLGLQYKLPSWSDSGFMDDKYDGLVISSLDGGVAINFGGPSVMAKWTVTSGTNMTIRFVSVVRVFSAAGALKYVLTAPILTWSQIGSAGTGWPVNNLSSFVNIPCVSVSDSLRIRGATVSAGDFPVIEIGAVFFPNANTNGTLVLKMGDDHSYDNIGFAARALGNGAAGEPISTNPANPICIFAFRSPT